jgi:hypothetical protein
MYQNTIGVGQSVHTDIDWLLSDFYTGKTLYKELSEKIFNTIFVDKKKQYMHYINRAKFILDHSEKDEYDGLYVIHTNPEVGKVTSEEKVALIRYINVCHGHKNPIIILNDEIIYVHADYTIAYGLEIVHEEVNKALKKYRLRKKMLNKKYKIRDTFYKFLRMVSLKK